MSSFTDATFEPVLLPNGRQKRRPDGGKVWRVRGRDGDGFRFYIGFPGSGLEVHVPEGRETDLMSRPTMKSKGVFGKVAGLFAGVIPRKVIEQVGPACAVHDKLREDPLFATADADGVFWTALTARQSPETWRWIFFNAVITNGSKEVHGSEPLPG